MSIKIMSRVWEKSKQGGSQLLLLLAIADNANDEGVAWPGQEYLARKIRMHKRSIPRLTKKLKETGELFIVDRSIKGKSTHYVVLTGMSWAQFGDTLQTHFKYTIDEILGIRDWFDMVVLGLPEAPRGDDKLSGGGMTICQGGVDIAVSRGDDNLSGGVDIAVSTEPSLTSKETSFLQNSQKLSSNEQTNEIPDFPPEKKTDLNKLVPYLASISDIQDKDDLRSVTLLGYKVAQVCKLDIALTSIANLKTIARVTLALNTKKITQPDLKNFQTWWYNEYWLGKDKNQPPTPGQLGDRWGQFEESRQMTKSSNSNGPTLTPEEQAQLEYFIAQDAQK